LRLYHGRAKDKHNEDHRRLENVTTRAFMGAIGYHIPAGSFGFTGALDMSVAIRTMVVRDRVATFNVGGGIVIDSDPEMNMRNL
jgi:anthranilate/para-aminobenzoate synthase component I